MRLISKNLSKITDKERLALSKLTLKTSSLMKADILNAEEDLENIKVFMLKEKEEIMAWCSVLPSNFRYYCLRSKHKGPKPARYAKIYTYVKADLRGQGLGKKLISKAVEWALKQNYVPKVLAWNFTSFKFFKSCNSRGLNLNVVNYSGYRI